MTPFYFRIVVDERRAIRVNARVDEYEVAERTWLVTATCQLWRMTRMRGGTGQLIGLGPLSDPLEVAVRGSSIDDALQRLVDTATHRICNALRIEH